MILAQIVTIIIWSIWKAMKRYLLCRNHYLQILACIENWAARVVTSRRKVPRFSSQPSYLVKTFDHQLRVYLMLSKAAVQSLVQGIPDLFQTTYTFSISTDEHVPLKFLMTRKLSKITKTHCIFNRTFIIQNMCK